MSINLIEQAITLMNKYGQTRLADHLAALDPGSAKILAAGYLELDPDNFEKIRSEYFKNIGAATELADSTEPDAGISAENMPADVRKKYFDLGLDLLKQGKAAVLTLAGGQGTRLGHNGPKGTFAIGPVKGESLFELQCERLKAQSRLAGKNIPWYIMTGPENNKDTIDFFEAHDHFGYGREDIRMFTQGVLPMMDLEGNMLLRTETDILTGPDGNGGIFASLAKSGAIGDMKRRGVEWVLATGIDNALTKMADPLFLGFTHSSGCPIGAKSTARRSADEKAGVFAKRNGRPAIIEYFELPPEIMNSTGSDGSLKYGDVNIVIHLFRLDFIEMITNRGLPYHAAKKKTEYFDPISKLTIASEKPVAVKFEAFIFDSFNYADCLALLRVKREEEFAPVKNRTGEDSPDTARRLLEAQMK